MARFPRAVWLALLLTACGNPHRELERAVSNADASRLRHDAAVVYKDAFASSHENVIGVARSGWPKSFAVLNPVRVNAYRDGIAIALSPGTDSESGAYVIPEGMDHQPADNARARFRPLREGVYWYDFGVRHD